MSSPRSAARSVSDRSDERGAAAIATVAALGFVFVMFTLFAQFAVWQYGRGVVRSAALEAARAAAPVGALPGACERRFDDVRSGLLGGSLGASVGSPRCAVGDEFVTVEVDVAFRAWLPISPDWEFTVDATSVRERIPE